MSAHSSIAVANYLLRKAKDAGNPLTPMKLIKLVYICHGWMLGLYGRPLIGDEIQAWRYGPVIKDLYHAVKQYRDRPVTQEIQADSDDAEFDSSEKLVMDIVFSEYGKKSGIALSSLTHSKGTPWDKTWRGQYNDEIPTDLIQEHYSQLVERVAER